jgi:hypothetical protein
MGSLKSKKTLLFPNPMQVDFNNKEEMKEFIITLTRVLTDLSENTYDDLEMLNETKADK